MVAELSSLEATCVVGVQMNSKSSRYRTSAITYICEFVEDPTVKIIVAVEGLHFLSGVDDAVSRIVKGLPVDAVLRVEGCDSENQTKLTTYNLLLYLFVMYS